MPLARRAVLTLGALGIAAAVMVALLSSERPRVPRDVVERTGPVSAPSRQHPELRAGTSATARTETGAPEESAPGEPTPSVVTVELRTIDARTRARVDPRNYVVARNVDVPHREVKEEFGELDLLVEIPADRRTVDVVVQVDGWGYLPYEKPLVVHAEPAVQRAEVALEPIADADWVTTRLTLLGEGPTIAEDEALTLWLNAPSRQRMRPPSLDVVFLPGDSRTREVRATSRDFKIEFDVAGHIDDQGRRIWIDARGAVASPDSVRRVDEDWGHSVTVDRAPAGVLVVDVSAGQGHARASFEVWGSWVVGPRERRRVTTYHGRVVGGADVLRIVRGPGELRGLGAKSAQLVGTLEPGTPIEFEGNATHHAVLRLAPP